MTREGFDNEYLKWLQQLDVGESDSAWEAIENELDKVETWTRINKELDRIMPPVKKIIPLPIIRLAGVAAAIIFIISVPLFLVLKKDRISPVLLKGVISETFTSGSTPDDLIPHVQGGTSADDSSVNILNDHVSFPRIAEIKNGREISPTGHGLNPHDGEVITASEEMEIFSKPGEEKVATKRSEADVFRITGIPIEIEMRPLSGYDSIMDLVAFETYSGSRSGMNNGRFFRIHDAGFVYSYKNTWLLNYETWNGLNPAKLGNTLPTFRHDFGITSAISLKNKYLVGFEFFWMSGAGQDYQQYINASFVDRKISLNYFKLQAWYQWDHKKIPGSTIVGGYFARLEMAKETQGIQEFNVIDDYRDHDYGLVLGYQLNMPLINNIAINPGVRLSYNLMNMFKGHNGITNVFKSTNSFSVGINMSLTYNFF